MQAGFAQRAVVAAMVIGSFGATAAQAFSDSRIFLRGVLVATDPQATGPSNSTHGLGGLGVAGAYADFGTSPTEYLGSTYIQLNTDTTDAITTRSYAELSAQWRITDTNTLRTGLTSVRLAAQVDYSYDFGTFTDATVNVTADLYRFDNAGNINGFVGNFACGASVGQLASCSGGFDTSGLAINWVGSTWTIQGTAFVDFDVDVNADQYLGFGFGNQADTPTGGIAGSILDLGAGNELSYTITPNEGSVTASLVPEPGVATLLALSLLAGAAARRRALPTG